METIQNIAAPKSHYPIVIISWKDLDQVQRDDAIGVYEYSVTEEETTFRTKQVLRSQYTGKMTILIQPGTTVLKPSTPLGTITEPCGHAVQLAGLCALCGKDLTGGDYHGTDTTRATINMTHDAKGVTVSLDEASRLEVDNASRLRQQKKLSLILDLDQTVIHATVDPTVGEWLSDSTNPNYPALSDVHSFVLPDSPIVYYIKLRPGTREFLAEMSRLYEMHIYTMGTRLYAQAVAAVLDPTQDYFKSRILSRDESGSFSFKSIQRLFPCDQSMVVVVDDRGDVWDWSPNLLKVWPYDFFQGIGDINEPVYEASKDDKVKESDVKLEMLHDIQLHAIEAQEHARPLAHSQEEVDKLEEAKEMAIPVLKRRGSSSRPVLVDSDRVLEAIGRILKKIQRLYYTEKTKDVQLIVPKLKSAVLDGVHILFSSVIPLGQDPEYHQLWIMATSFGAVCHLELNEYITHVVAAKVF